MSIITTTQKPTQSKPISSTESSREQTPAWTQTALRMIKTIKNCTPRDVADFEYLVHANRGKINDKTFVSDSTILHELGKHGPLEFLPPLIRHGIDFSVQDTFLKDTPLMWAIANGRNDMAKEMLVQLPESQVSSLDKQCAFGHTALHLLIAKGYTTHTLDGALISCSNFELLRLAVHGGARINLADNRGNTPLHLAYARRDYGMIKFLIDHGADQDYLNNAGQKPKDLVYMYTNEDKNFEQANAVLFDTVGNYYMLKENDYKNSENLRAILTL